MPAMANKRPIEKERISIRIDAPLLAKVDRVAADEGRTRTGAICRLICEAITARDKKKSGAA
jgi:metal-responsive CopG/Arc/MetJ family transcriptional regulator